VEVVPSTSRLKPGWLGALYSGTNVSPLRPGKFSAAKLATGHVGQEAEPFARRGHEVVEQLDVERTAECGLPGDEKLL